MPARREFLKRTLLAGAAISPSLAGLASVEQLHSLLGRNPQDDAQDAGYGPLVPAGPELALPTGFRYVAFGIEHSPMSDGIRTPGGHDGMAAFAMPNGTIRLVRNHEMRGLGVAAEDPARAYDPKGPGGTSTIELRLRSDGSPEILRSWMSITGTCVNCAGGPTPWGSWLTCEETTVGKAQGFEQEHGYVFEVPAAADAPVQPVPLKAMGRFVHEAIAVDPLAGIVYLTEDQNRAGFYRFLPRNRTRLVEGGRLQMLAVTGRPQFNAARGQRPGAALPVSWVTIADADPSSGDASAVFTQGYEQGGTRFSRLEGAWWGDDSVYFHATNGGDARLGQVWRYRPRENTLVLVYESTNRAVLDQPDNITVSPRGGIVICEDASGTCHLRGLSPQGEIFPFARNLLNDQEFAGATFSPDGRVLFVNIQGITMPDGDPTRFGRTFAIWGPWERGAL
ncbi:MAG TPA: alkaline phosphatase PhoX [Gemmatimonadaceae bacterium]